MVRTDIRWDDQSPVAQLLAGIPRSQRVKLIRAILEAALLPGGWAKLTATNTSPAVQGALLPEPTAIQDVPQAEDALAGTGMSAAGAQGFLAGLRAFGVLDED